MPSCCPTPGRSGWTPPLRPPSWRCSRPGCGAGIGHEQFLTHTFAALKLRDFITGLSKAAVFGVIISTLACYLAKLAGLSLPARVLERPRVRHIAALLPIALLAALTALQTVSSGSRLVIDARLAGVAAGAVALLLRAPFIVVVAVAAGTAALIRVLN